MQEVNELIEEEPAVYGDIAGNLNGQPVPQVAREADLLWAFFHVQPDDALAGRTPPCWRRSEVLGAVGRWR
jgi:hypothetical protein